MHTNAMKLADWMETTGTTDAGLAEKVKRDRSTVTRWRRGQTRPDWEALETIQHITKGAVTAVDFVAKEAAA